MSDSLRILLIPSIFPPDSGGPATFVPDLCRALHDRGHDVRVVTNGLVDPGFDEKFPFEVVRVKRTEPLPVRYLRQIAALVQEISAFEPDVVLSNGSDLQPAVATTLTGVPLISKIVGDGAWERAQRRANIRDDIETFQTERYGLEIRLYKTIRNFEVGRFDHVVVPSEYLRKFVLGWGKPRSETSVIYNALDLNVSPPPIEDRAPDILTVARLVEWKGIEGVIDAFERVAKDRPESSLHVVGDGRRRDALERHAAQSGVSDRITFHGRVPHERVLELMQRSRAFALNSTYEGLPHVVLEAMACGIPPVVSNAGGNPEVVRDGESGFVVEQGHVEAMASRFETLLNDDETTSRFRREGFKLLDERFDHSEMIEAYETLFWDIATRADG